MSSHQRRNRLLRLLRRSLQRGPQRSARRRSLRWEQLEDRRLLVSDWHNVLQPFNTTGDEIQSVDPLDVLSIINEINGPKIRPNNSSSQLPPAGSNGVSPPPYVDVDCDNQVTPLDVLAVINAINGNRVGPSWKFDQRGGSGSGTGAYRPDGCLPRLVEGNSLSTTLTSELVIPTGMNTLTFEYQSLQFDTSSNGRMRDAFEAALLDERDRPLVRTLATDRDSFFNVTEGLDASNTADVLATSSKVSLSLVDVLPGTKAKLVLRLVNNDGDSASAVTIQSVRFESIPPLPGPLPALGSMWVTAPQSEQGSNGNLRSNSSNDPFIQPPVGSVPGRPISIRNSSNAGVLNSEGGGMSSMGPQLAPPSSPIIDSRGKEFWVGFPDNLFEGNNQPQKVLYLSGEIATTGEVTIPGLIDPSTTQPFRRAFVVNPGVVTVVELPSQDIGDGTNDDDSDYDVEAERIARIGRRGIHVVANEPITVYGLNLAVSTSDAFLALPVPSLGTEYINLGYENTFASITSVEGTQYLVVATQDNTQVTMATGPYSGATRANQARVFRPNGTSEFSLGNSDGQDIGPFGTDPEGTGSLVVTPPFEGYAGEYDFELIDIASAAIHANLNEKVTVSFPTGREAKVYAFDVVAGQHLYYDAIFPGFPAPSVSVQLLSPSGERAILDAQSDSDSFANRFGAWQIRETGKYYVLMIGEHTTAFDFGFRLMDMQAAPTIAFGSNVSGASNPGGMAEVYRFSAIAGQVIYYDALSQDRNVLCTVYGPGGQQILVTSAPDEQIFVAPETGTYYVVLDGSVFRPSSFEFRMLDLRSSPSLAFGVSTEINVASGRQTAVRFNGSAAQTFEMEIQNISPPFRTTYQVVDSAGRAVPLEQMGNRFSGRLLFDGEYFLLVGALTTAEGGDVTIAPRLVSDPSVTKSGMNAEQTLTISAGGEATYTFDAPAGTRILVDALNTQSSNLNVELKGPDGTRLFTGFGFANDTQDIPRLGPAFLPQSGTYRLTVRGNASTDSGSYRFRVLDLDTFGTPISFGTLVNGNFPTQREAVLYTFDAATGDQLLFDGRSGSFIYGIYDEGLNPILSKGIFGATGVDDADGLGRVMRSGRHYLLFQSDASVPQEFGFVINKLASAPSLGFGEEAAGTVPSKGQFLYRIGLQAGARIRFDNLLPFSSDVNYRIASTGGRVLFDSGFQAVDSGPPGPGMIVVPESGEYVVSIQSRRAIDSGFRFRIDNLAVSPTLPFNTDLEITLSPGHAAHVYRFDASAGDTIRIDSLETTSTPLDWDIRGPVSQFRGGSNDGLGFTAKILSTGTYYLSLSGRLNSSSLTFRFRATRMAGPIVPLVGFNQQVQLDLGINETKTYSFDAPTGRLVYLNVLKSEFRIPTHTVTLDRGETYLMRDLAGGVSGRASDLTGSIITSTKPIAVFGGNRASFVPSQFFAADHLVEQLPPTNTWGREFVTMPLATNSQRGDRFRFLAQADGTQVTVNGTVVATLRRGEYHEQVITGPGHIVANQPILVAQYAHSQNYYRSEPGGNPSFVGDPLMMIVPPFEQFLSSYTVSTPVQSAILNAQRFDRNYINLVVPSEAVGRIELNGVAVETNRFVAIGSTGFSGAQVPIALGVYELAGPLPFGVFVYGFGAFDSYGYVGGQSLAPVAKVNSVDLTPAVLEASVNEAITLTARVADATGSPLSGIRVDFDVAGANAQKSFGFSDENGLVVFRYTGLRDGRDIVTASVGEILDDSIVDWIPGADVPQIFVTSPRNRSSVNAGTTLVATGLAIADFPLATIDLITVNGSPITDVDAAGNFFVTLFVGPGDNEFEFTVIDSSGQTTSQIIIVRGAQRDPAQFDFSQFANVTGSFREEYARSSLHQGKQLLVAETAIKNIGQFPTDVPLLVGITNISDPMILVRDADGVTPDGIPYYDFTDMVTGGSLNPSGSTGFLSTKFFNPNLVPFTYDLVFYGKLNAPPEIRSVPIVEVEVGSPYAYDVLASDPNGDPIRFELVEAPAGMTIGELSGHIRWQPTTADQGVHSIEVRVVDSRMGTASQRFSLSAQPKPANRAPLFTSLPIALAEVGTSYPYVPKAVDADNDTLTFRLLAAPLGMTIESNGALGWQPSVEQLGTQRVVIEVSDPLGGSAQQGFSVLVVSPAGNRAPVIVSDPPSAMNRSGITHQVIAIDPNNEPVTYRLLRAPSGMTISSSGSIRWTPTPDQSGMFHFAIEVLDARGGRDEQNVSLTIFDNDDPIITSSAVVQAAVNTNYVYQVTATDAIGDTLTFSLRESPIGMTIDPSTGLIRWPVTTGAFETEPVTVEVSDGRGGIARQSFAILVSGGKSLAVPNDPVFVSQPSPVASVGIKYRYAARARDPDGAPLRFDLPLGPEGMVIDTLTGQLGWIPRADQAGAQQVVIRVSNRSGGIALQAFRIEVDTMNTPPVISSQPPSGASVGNAWEYRIHAQDAEADPLAWELVRAPAGMTIEPLSDSDADAVVSWAPSIPGPTEVVIAARDPRGGRTEQRFSIQVAGSAINLPPIVRSIARSSIPAGQPWAYVVAADDPNGDPITITMLTAPPGMSLDSGMRTLLWTPTSAQVGSHPVAIRIADGRGGVTEHSFSVQVLANSIHAAPEIVSPPSASRATVGEPFRYDLRATDEDGDPVEWRLEEAPHGASIDRRYGTLRWSPTLEQLGLQRFVVSARDPLGWEAKQSFSLIVSGVNLAPLILSRAPTEAVVDERFVYGIRAVDPENNPLTFGLVQGPAGMTIDSVRGIVRWTPAVSQLGMASVTLEVDDGRGNRSTQTFSLRVTETIRNLDPIITSRANFRARVDAMYQYDVQAVDPEGRSLTYSLISSPSGMQIDATTGLVTWTPALAQAGSHLVQVAVQDAEGGRSLQRFAILVRANQAPEILSLPITQVSVGGLYQYDVQVTDPEGDTLSYALVTHPVGMAIDSLGRIQWQTAPGVAASHSVSLRVTDAFGATAIQNFVLTVAPDTIAPKIKLRLSANPLVLGEYSVIAIQASDDVGIADVKLTMNGQPLGLDANRSATIRGDATGLRTLRAIAVDTSGNEGTDEATLRIFDPTDTQGPTIQITAPVPNATVTKLSDIKGSILDDQLQFYRIEYGRADLVDINQPELDDPDYRLLALGTSQAVDRVLATFDPTVLSNDDYVIRILAQDLSGNVSTKVIPVSLDGQLKLGSYNFEFMDLTIPLSGIPISIRRTYNTQDAAESGDFGFGWTLSVQDAQIRESIPVNALEDQGFTYAATPFRDGTRVYMTKPDGKRVGFTFRPTPQFSLFGGGSWLPRFVSDPGVQDRLDVGSVPLRRIGDAFYSSLFGDPFNPSSYRLTTKDGTVYEYGQFGGLANAYDRNGNRLEFRPDGVFSSSGPSIRFLRDSQGRISQIIDPVGNVYRYIYNASNDLVETIDPMGLSRRYSYFTTPAHYLRTIVDPNGESVFNAQFDSQGRLTSSTNAGGASIQNQFFVSEQKEVTTDPLGNQSTVFFDDRGNIRRVERPSGVVSMEYDSQDNLIKTTDESGNVVTQTFDQRGNLVAMTNPLGGTYTNQFNASGQVTSTRDPMGRSIEMVYDSAGNLIKVVNALGIVTSASYDRLGRVVQSVDAKGATLRMTYGLGLKAERVVFEPPVTMTAGAAPANAPAANGLPTQRFEYNHLGQVILVIDENGNATTYEYDAIGRPVATTDAMGGRYRYQYQGDRLVEVVDPLGRSTKYEYDNLGRRIREIDPAGGISSTEYNARNQVIASTDPLGRTIRYVHNGAGRMESETDALGNTTRYEYNAVGFRTAVIDALQHRWIYRYDALGRLLSYSDPLGGTTTYTYDSVGNNTHATDANGNTTQFDYDGLKRLVNVVDAQGNTSGIAYDAEGNVVAVTDPKGRVSSFEYDDRDRLVKATDPAGFVRRQAFDDVGNRVRVTDELGDTTELFYDAANRGIRTRDSKGNTTHRVLDAFGNTVRFRNELGQTSNFELDALNRVKSISTTEGRIIRKAYDAVGNEVAFTDPAGNTTRMEYDGLNRLLRRIDPLSHAIAFGYDGVGNLVSRIDRNGRETRYAYDATRRLTSETWLSGAATLNQLVATFDAMGNLLTATDHRSSLQFTYDTLNRRVSQDNAGTLGIPRLQWTATLDSMGNAEQVTDSFGTVFSRALDSRDQVGSIRMHGGGTDPMRVDFTYSPRGQKTSEVRFADLAGNQKVGSTRWLYNAQGQLTDLTHFNALDAILVDFDYAYDAMFQLTDESGSSGNKQYQYDQAGQLQSVDKEGARVETYQYDANGNRVGAGVVLGLGNRLLEDGTFRYAYDNEGNLVEKLRLSSNEKWLYSYDHRNRMTRAESRSAAGATLQVIQYGYDPLNRRISIEKDGATLSTVYVGQSPWADFDGAGNLVARYMPGSQIDELLSRYRPSEGVSWYLVDRLGSMTHIADNTGAIVSQVSYDSYGNILSETNPARGDRFKFAGREWDEATGLYYNRARYYDPKAGRFVSEDPLAFWGGDANLRRYAGNDPVNSTDPMGLQAMSEGGGLMAFVSYYADFALTYGSDEPFTFRIGCKQGACGISGATDPETKLKYSAPVPGTNGKLKLGGTVGSDGLKANATGGLGPVSASAGTDGFSVKLKGEVGPKSWGQFEDSVELNSKGETKFELKGPGAYAPSFSSERADLPAIPNLPNRDEFEFLVESTATGPHLVIAADIAIYVGVAEQLALIAGVASAEDWETAVQVDYARKTDNPKAAVKAVGFAKIAPRNLPAPGNDPTQPVPPTKNPTMHDPSHPLQDEGSDDEGDGSDEGDDPNNDSDEPIELGDGSRSGLGDLVWHDMDRSGVQDPGEAGIGGVRVWLYSPGSDGQIGGGDDLRIGERVTDGMGYYFFGFLEPGVYFLRFDVTTLPVGFVPTKPNVGSDDARDSDANEEGYDSLTTLEPGEVDMTHDLGIHPS
ncbi:MAG: putative Ig domain-containing protein [Planctomycetota bacterium]